MSQRHDILRHLKRRPITALEALERYGCMRLAARIEELRGSGHKIETDMVKKGDKRFAKYRLVV